MQHVSLRLTASILPDSLHGESRICCLRHHRENGNSNTARKHKQNNHIQTTRNTYSDPSRIQIAFQTHWKPSWMWHDRRDWSFQDTITRKLLHSAALPINSLLHALQNPGQIQGDGEWTSSWNETSYSLNHCNSWSVHRTRRVNLELNKISYSLTMQIYNNRQNQRILFQGIHQ